MIPDEAVEFLQMHAGSLGWVAGDKFITQAGPAVLAVERQLNINESAVEAQRLDHLLGTYAGFNPLHGGEAERLAGLAIQLASVQFFHALLIFGSGFL